MNNVNELNWDRFKELAAKLIDYKAKVSSVPVRAESWEEVIYAVLLYMEYEVTWDPTSHAKGVDVEVSIGQETIRISAKGGKINNQMLSLSSYRLTRFGSFANMLGFLKDNADELDIYLICAREAKYRLVRYNVFKLLPKELVPDMALKAENWEENNQGWELKANIGFEARIVKSMSSQLWYSIPLGFPPLERLATVEIPESEIGSKLVEILESLDK